MQDVRLSGNPSVSDEDIEERIATRESPRFLGLFPGLIYDYEIFDRYVLERDLQRIQRYYRSLGYYNARVRAGRVFYDGRNARVHILVEEGEPVLVRRVDVHGLQDLPPDVAAAVQTRVAARLRLAQPFAEERFEQGQADVLNELAEHGYARATARRAADVDIPKNTAAVGYWVEPGRPARFGEVRIVGLGQLPEEPVRRALGLRPGDPYSQSEIEDAERALLYLGVFTSVAIEADPKRVDEKGDEIPLVVRVEPSRLRSVHLGGGILLDSQRTDLHLVAGWEDRNFFGGMRRFQVETVPGLVLYPTRLPTFETPERLLPMARLRVNFTQPGFLEHRTNALVRGEVSVYPLLLSTNRDEETPVLGYRDLRVGVGLERTFWRTYAEVTHNVQVSSPFSYLGTLDPDLGTVVVSYPQVYASLDLRDDRVRPRSGLYLANDLQVAGVGGDARDVKLQPEVRAYIPFGRRLSLAARASIGLLFASNYGDTIEENALTGSVLGVSRATWVRDVQLMFLRGFFGGGPGSNRGYGLREIGPHGTVPFYNPGQSSMQLTATCDPASNEYSPAVCDLPLGGFTLWEASLELRYPLAGPLYGAAFVDAADVSARLGQFRFNRPHLSPGLGLRYETPVGPIRIDIGYRVPGLQAPEDAPDERRPTDIFGIPIAISFGIGESF